MSHRDLPPDIAAGVRWMEDREAGAICNVDCGCACHDKGGAPCKECCTRLEDERDGVEVVDGQRVRFHCGRPEPIDGE